MRSQWLSPLALALALTCSLAAPSLAPLPPAPPTPCAKLPVWPIPQRCAAAAAPSGPPLALDGNFSIQYGGTSLRLRRAVRRYTTILRYAIRNTSAAGPLKALRLVVEDEADDYPGWGTATNHSVTVGVAEAVVAAESIYGAMHGMETFAQLTAGGALEGYGSVVVSDWADREYRGLMLDTGRRFFPPSLVRAYLDAMSHAKMSVLHLHLTDEFRWSVESKRYPALTSGLESGEFYTQAELRALIEYGWDRGIRLVPEVDVPAHTACMQPLADAVVFCSDTDSPGHAGCVTEFGLKCAPRGQLHDDDENKSITVVRSLLTEVAAIFSEEELFHMGGDETLPMGACSRSSIGSFCAKVLAHLASLGKTPAAWQEVLWGSFGSHDNAPLAEIPKGTVFQIALDTAGHFDKRPASCGNLTRTGARCINSLVEHFYLVSRHDIAGIWVAFFQRCQRYRCGGQDIAGGAPHQWYDLDIGLSNPAAERRLVGGEVCLCKQPHDCRRDCNNNCCNKIVAQRPAKLRQKQSAVCNQSATASAACCGQGATCGARGTALACGERLPTRRCSTRPRTWYFLTARCAGPGPVPPPPRAPSCAPHPTLSRDILPPRPLLALTHASQFRPP